MPTPAALRADALRLDRQADECVVAATTLERRRLALERRLEPVLRAHDERVWSSRAATASRMHVRITGAGELGRVREALIVLVGALRREADHRAHLAAGNRRRAAELELVAGSPATEAVGARGWGYR
ncbi:MAG: hypothetical protein AAF081_05520 [Actinomycetota bacterium]